MKNIINYIKNYAYQKKIKNICVVILVIYFYFFYVKTYND
ncbi:hypothetical protein PFMALIP_01935 [Plasmodium falciparum MaliPS096_E11]|uniref:Uncharacterized protein n=1 Tax=Plasmodium falciparum MaliPS096_E11 TaxID=1036727 RepID=A0A024WU92_PLAFA|nr:hypothetical protein PFMALIP_01935 [Plasmodium falciparum MaliPS096_E11]